MGDTQKIWIRVQEVLTVLLAPVWIVLFSVGAICGACRIGFRAGVRIMEGDLGPTLNGRGHCAESLAKRGRCCVRK